jgi:hypothetical protein
VARVRGCSLSLGWLPACLVANILADTPLFPANPVKHSLQCLQIFLFFRAVALAEEKARCVWERVPFDRPNDFFDIRFHKLHWAAIVLPACEILHDKSMKIRMLAPVAQLQDVVADFKSVFLWLLVTVVPKDLLSFKVYFKSHLITSLLTKIRARCTRWPARHSV